MDAFDRLIAKGIKIRITDGVPFNPVWQDRTDAMDDIIKAKEKRDEHKGNTRKDRGVVPADGR